MLNSLKSLMVVMLVLWPVAFLVRRQMIAVLPDAADWRRMSMIWASLIIASFLAMDFWIFSGIAALLLLRFGALLEDRFALYFLVLIAVPPLQRNVPGFGLINYLISLDYLRLLSLLILLPVSIKIHAEGRVGSRIGDVRADYAMLAFFVLKTLLYLPYTNITSLMRNIFDYYISVWLPYYVASRLSGGLPAFARTLLAYGVAGVVAGVLAVFEWAKHWGLYAAVGPALGLQNVSVPLMRDGLLRAEGSTGQPITLGFVLSVALGFWIYVQENNMNWKLRWFGFSAIVAGLAVTISRGPWVGAAAMLGVYLVLAPGARRRLLVGAGSSVAVVGLLSLTPYGSTILYYLPFTGNNVDSGSSEYRTNLFLVSSSILSYYPFFGTPHFMDYMESLKTGAGLVDLVNTYLIVALPTGYVGLILWLTPFFFAFKSALSKCTVRHDPGVRRLAATLVSVLVGCMVTIGTVSPIGVTSYLLWLLVGLCVAVGRLEPPVLSDNAVRSQYDAS